MSKNLTEEEKAFFESGGAAELPDDYLNDAKIVSQDQPQTEEPNAPQPEATGTEEPQGETQELPQEPEQGAEPQQRDKPTVPLATYMEEKKARQERDRQLAEMNGRYSQAVDRFQTFLERSAAAQQPQQPIQQQNLEPPTDPIEKIEWATQQVANLTRERQEEAAQREHQARIQDQQRQVTNVYSNALRSAAASAPEVSEVREFLVKQRIEEHMSGGLSFEDARAATWNDEMNLVTGALQRGVNPVAQLIMTARARGYVPHSMRQQSAAPATHQVQPQAAQRLETVAQGQQANVSLSTAGTSGNARPSKLDAKAIADMPDREFKKLLEREDFGEIWSKAMA
jgi:hypothetical protein